MKRRGAVIAMLAGVAALMTKKAEAEVSLVAPVTTLTFGLSQFKSFVFLYEGERVELTPAEMFAALKG
jgi:hypothetical protein